MSTYNPPVLWAQRKDKLYITIDVQDCTNPKLKLEKLDSEGVLLMFSCKVGGAKDVGGAKNVDVELELIADVDTDAAKVSVTGRHVVVVIPKKTECFWPRLTKDKPPRFVSVDWSKWVDEDEEEAAPDFDLGSMGQFGGLDQFDSDDDDDEEEEEGGKEQETKNGEQDQKQEAVDDTPA